MPIQLTVTSNLKYFKRNMDFIEKTQIPFATASALTWTAKDCQKGIIRQIPAIFQNKKKWWLPRQPTGIKIIPAKKNVRLWSRVYTKAYFMWLQEHGGFKRPFRSSTLAIPTKNVAKSHRKSGGARTVLKQKTTFSTKRGIYRRKGGKKAKSLELLFHYDKIATIVPRFGFQKRCYIIANNRFNKNFVKAVERAFKR